MHPSDDARQRAIAGAQLIIDTPRTKVADAAAAVGSHHWSVTQAYTVMKYGNEDEIAVLKGKTMALARIAAVVRKRLGGRPRKPIASRRLRIRALENRTRAFRAARAAIAGSSQRIEAKREGVNITTVSDAVTILRNATPEQIAKVESGELSLTVFVERLRETIPREDRKRTHTRPKLGHEGRQVVDSDVAIFAHLRTALEEITALPQPADVARIIRKHRVRVDTVNKNLIAAFGWLTEFSDEWTK